MVKIRLRRMGSRHKPFFRVVVSDSRRTPTASAIEEIGYYDPRKDPSVVKIDLERLEHWVGHGAQLSDAVRKLARQARTGATEAPVEEKKAAPEAPVEEKAAPEAPVEEKAAEEPAVEEKAAEEPAVEEKAAEEPAAEAEAAPEEAEAEEKSEAASS